MSLLNDILHSVLKNDTSSAESPKQKGEALLTATLLMIDKAGGIEGLIEKFHQSGLGDVVSSWISTGQNQAIKPDDLSKAFGAENIQILAKESQVSEGQGEGILSVLLPILIDQMTPNGQIPEQGQMMKIGRTVLDRMLAPEASAAKTNA